MPMDLPYAAEADIDINVDELEYLEAKYNAELEDGRLTADTSFLFAWGLIRSGYSQDNRIGVKILQDLLRSDKDRQRECLYYLALGHHKLEEWGLAKQYAENLLSIEPENLQARSLLNTINEKVAKDGVIGLALIGGAVAAAAGLLVALLRSKRGSRGSN